MTTFDAVVVIFAIWLVYLVYLGIYRLYLSPISHVPGPLLAKLTYWYEFYYDVVCTGRYAFVIRDLHEKYGPILRINPDEVHINDPDFYDELYLGFQAKKRNKWPWMYHSFGIPESMFGTADHEVHRTRRNALNVYFSKAKVRSLQGMIVEVGERLCKRLQEFKESAEVLPIGLAWTAVTSDIAGSYTFGGLSFNRILAPDFNPDFHIASEALAKSSHLVKHMPFIVTFMKALPDTWAVKADPNMGAILQLQRGLQRATAKIQSDVKMPDYKPPTEPTVFHEILNSPVLSDSDKHHARLWQEGQLITVAGTVTTAVTMSYLVFYLLTQPNDLRRLREELLKVMPDSRKVPDISVLESQPFLTACIMEALRTSNGLSTRLARQDPENNIVYVDKTMSPTTQIASEKHAEGKAYVLPPNTPISMTTMLIHLNPKIYPEPLAYKPDRWVDKVDGKYVLHNRLNKYYAPFSRGTRACLGINLANAELYIFLSMVFRRYGSEDVQMDGDDGILELYETNYYDDIEIVGDGITPIMREGQRGVRIKVLPAKA